MRMETTLAGRGNGHVKVCLGKQSWSLKQDASIEHLGQDIQRQRQRQSETDILAVWM